MSFLFKENGRFSQDGLDLTKKLRDELYYLFGMEDVEDMTVQELQILGSNLASLVGETISAKIQEKNKINQ